MQCGVIQPAFARSLQGIGAGIVTTTVILDLDGPILDGRYRHHACYQTILGEHGYRPLEIDDYWQMKRQRKDRRAQLAASGAETLYGRFLERWLELIETRPFLALDRLQPGVPTKLAAWKNQGVRLVLATQRRDRESLIEQLAELGLDSSFQHVVVCDHEKGA